MDDFLADITDEMIESNSKLPQCVWRKWKNSWSNSIRTSWKRYSSNPIISQISVSQILLKKDLKTATTIILMKFTRAMFSSKELVKIFLIHISHYWVKISFSHSKANSTLSIMKRNNWENDKFKGDNLT